MIDLNKLKIPFSLSFGGLLNLIPFTQYSKKVRATRKANFYTEFFNNLKMKELLKLKNLLEVLFYLGLNIFCKVVFS